MSTHDIPALDGREWWPSDYVDESMPQGRATPSAWLFRLNDGAQRFGEADSEDFPSWSIGEGETARFIARDDLGTAVMIVEEGGTERWEPRPPDDAYLCDVGDHEMGGDGPDDFARNLRSFFDLEAGERVEVRANRLSNEVLCRFTAQDGPPRFIAISPLPADPEEPMALPETDQAEMLGERP